MRMSNNSSRSKSPTTDPQPHDEDAERAVLGSLLVDPDATYRVQDVGLEPGHFYNVGNGAIYKGIMALVADLKPVDVVLLCERLRQDGAPAGKTTLDILGGPAAVLSLIETTPTAIHVAHYAQTVLDLYRRRRLIGVAGQIAGLAHTSQDSIESVYTDALRMLMGVTRVETQGSHLYGSDDALVEYIAKQTGRRERLAADPDAMIKTGIPSLDDILGDISPGTLHAIVARSSVGKTIYMEQVAEYNAKRGHRVAFYHLELSHEMMADRLMARHAGVSVNELRRGYGGRELAEAMQRVRGWYRNIVYIHCPGWTAERISADVQRLVARDECEIAIVDYLQKITLPSGQKGLTGAMLYGLVAETLKNVAEIAGIPVVIGSQVSRDYKTRVDQRPRMEDIRNSGEIEEKANQVVVLHRPGENDAQRQGLLPFGSPIPMEAWIEKNTQGGLGKVDLVHLAGRYVLGEKAGTDVVERIPF